MPLHEWNKEHLLSEEARMKSRTIWRYGMGALIGVYLIFSPLILGTVEDPASTLNAIVVGLALLTLCARALLAGEARTSETIRLAPGGWLLLAPFALNFASPAASRSAWIAGILLMATTDVSMLTAATDRTLRARSRLYRAMKLSPERVIGCRSSVQTETPETLSKHIVERVEQIQNTLAADPSPIEIEMCVLGYKSCATDMLLLEGWIEEKLPEANAIRSWRLKSARRKAIESLTRTRKALPPATAQALHPRVTGEGE